MGFVLNLSNYESTTCNSLWNTGLCQYCQAAGQSVVAKCAFEEGTNPGRSQKTQYISIIYILIYYISHVILHHIICTSTCHFRQIYLSHVVLSHIIHLIYHCICHISCKYCIMIRIIFDIMHDTGKVPTYITQILNIVFDLLNHISISYLMRYLSVLNQISYTVFLVSDPLGNIMTSYHVFCVMLILHIISDITYNV